MRTCLPLLAWLFGPLSVVVVHAQPAPVAPGQPQPPVAALIEAAQRHDIVAVSEPHGNEQLQALLMSLIRDPRFSTIVNDIVLEAISSRYQDVLDRYVRGDDVPEESIRRAWEDAVTPNSLGVHASQLVAAVRTINASRSPGQKVRVLAGDPPIDWANVVTDDDHRRWVELRDTYPADLIRRQVLDRGRRALVIYGQGHLQRAMIEANYDTTTWQAQTVLSIVTQDPNVRVFNVFTLLRGGEFLPEAARSWPTPSLVPIRGTSLGARDFGTYQTPLGGQRVAIRDGKFVPVPREQWAPMPLERQFDALLYLGPPNAFTIVPVPLALCRDAGALARRMERLRFVPPVEAQRLRQACEVP